MCGCWSPAAGLISRVNRSGPSAAPNGADDLERDDSVVTNVAGEVNRHAALPQLADQRVLPAERTWSCCAGSGGITNGAMRGSARARS